MPEIRFIGNVVPFNHYSTTMWGLPKINYKAADGSIEVDITITVNGSRVEAECMMPHYKKADLVHIHKIAYDAVRAAINVMSFSTGISLSVIFDRFIDESGKESAFIIHHPDLSKLCTAYSLETTATSPGPGDILRIIMSEPALFLALDDLITSTSLHHLITVNAARSIEGLRHAMAGAGMSREQEWDLFRRNLNLDKSYLRLITDSSVSGRHGDGIFIPGTITSEIITRSWTIMNRFLEFRKRGNIPLSSVDFPLLVG